MIPLTRTSAQDTLSLVERCGRLVGRIDELEQSLVALAARLDELASSTTDRKTAAELRALAQSSARASAEGGAS